MFILLLLVELAIFVCFILVLIKQFQNAGPIHGIIGIVTCTIWTFIWGWMNANRLGIKNIMMIWTVLLIIYLILGMLGGFSYGYPMATPTP